MIEAEALSHTKDLIATGRHRAHAALPVVRIFGPLCEDAINSGIHFISLLKKLSRYAPAVTELWPSSDFYLPEV